MAWTRLVSNSNAGNISLDIDYNLASVVRTSNSNVQVTLGIRCKSSNGHTWTQNSICAWIPAGGTRYYMFNSGSGSKKIDPKKYYYANTGNGTTSETSPFVINLNVGITDTSASFAVGYGWNGYSPSQKGSSTIWVSFPTGASKPSGLYCSVSSRTETKVSLNGGYNSDGHASITSSGYQYSTNNSSWSSFSNNSTTLSPNTTYYFRYYATNSQGTSYSGSTSTTTYQYPYVTSIQYSSVAIGSVQRVYFYNPLRRSITMYMRAKSRSGTVIYSTTTSSSDSVSFTVPIGAASNTLGSSSTSATAYYSVSYGSHDIDYVTGTYYIGSGGCAPTWNVSANNLIKYKDYNATTLALTNSNQDLVQGYSKIAYGINYNSYPASSNYGSTIDHYEVSIDGGSYTRLSSSSSSATIESGVIPSGTTTTISARAVDARGYASSPITKVISIIPYSNPTGSLTVRREGGYGPTVKLKADALWAISTKNKGTGYYQYCVDGTDSYSTATDISTFGSYITLPGTFDNDTVYRFRIKLTDQIGNDSAFIYALVGVGEPIMFIDTVQQGVGINCFPDEKGLYVKGNILKNDKEVLTEDGYCKGVIDYNDSSHGHIEIGYQGASLSNPSYFAGYDGNGHIKDVSIDNAKSTLGITKEAIGNMMYPIGAVYMSTKPTDPHDLFGVSWKRIIGYFLWGTNTTPKSTGGSRTTDSHVLTAAESGMPAHGHTASGSYSGSDFYIRHGKNEPTDTVKGGWNTWVDQSVGETWNNGVATSSYSHHIDRVNIRGTVGVSVSNAGSKNATQGHSHNYMPPYFEVYMWYRTE